MVLRPRGFSLVELMVTISVIGILAVIVYANVGTASPKARDAERQTDLRNLQIAIEKYKQKNGNYPAMGCPSLGSNNMSDESDCATYIAGLAPEFITVLPKDPRIGTGSGYAYVTNGTIGTTYKVMALGTVESETVTSAHPLKSCDTTAGMCNGSCGIGATLQSRSYGLWGGFAGATNDTPAQVMTATAAVICL